MLKQKSQENKLLCIGAKDYSQCLSTTTEETITVVTLPREQRSIAVEEWIEGVMTTLRQQKKASSLCQTYTVLFGKGRDHWDWQHTRH